jgi:hypothetical protein
MAPASNVDEQLFALEDAHVPSPESQTHCSRGSQVRWQEHATTEVGVRARGRLSRPLASTLPRVAEHGFADEHTPFTRRCIIFPPKMIPCLVHTPPLPVLTRVRCARSPAGFFRSVGFLNPVVTHLGQETENA